jgi:hypothetical protein
LEAFFAAFFAAFLAAFLSAFFSVGILVRFVCFSWLRKLCDATQLSPACAVSEATVISRHTRCCTRKRSRLRRVK